MTPPRPKGTTRPSAEGRIARLAAEQNLVVSTHQLRTCGVVSDAVTLRVRRGTLHRVYRGAYSIVPVDALTAKGWITAAVLAAGRGAVASGWGSGAWWQLVEWDGRHPEVIVPANGGRKIDGIRASRARLDERDGWLREGIRITSPARTALDLAPLLARHALRRMLRQAQAEGRLSVAQLVDALSRAPRHRGAAAIRAVIADGAMPTRSGAEDMLLDLIAEAGLPAAEVNPPLRLDGIPLMPDLLWPDHSLVVEVDGERFHASAIARRDDARRQALLEAHGYRVLRVDPEQLRRRPAQTIARIAAALTPAAGTPRRRPSSRRTPRPPSSGPSARAGSGA